MKHKLPEPAIDFVSIKKAALQVRALNHPYRQKILRLLHRYGTLTVTQLYERLQDLQPVVSMHLSILREARLVEVRREGKIRRYAVDYERLNHIQAALDQLGCPRVRLHAVLD